MRRRLQYADRLLGGKLTLDEHRHLLVASGWLSVLLACLQFDVSDRDAAEASRDAAFHLGRQAGHQEVMAWSFELLAWFALVGGRYREAAEFTAAGLELVDHAFVAVQLAVQRAKAWAQLGGEHGAEETLKGAAATLARLPVPEHPEHHLVFDARSCPSTRRPATSGSESPSAPSSTPARCFCVARTPTGTPLGPSASRSPASTSA